MGKTDYSQLELFRLSPEHAKAKPRASSIFLNYILNYEKAVLIVIGFIVIAVISFCLGVERGQKINPKTALPVNNPPRTNNVAVPAKELTAPVKSDKGTKGIFTIQIASFKSGAFAKKEIANLKRIGFTATTLSRGGYTIVCVGNFANKEDARTLLTELKKQYRDCIMRRL